MKHSVPACNFQSNNSFTSQKNPMGPDQEIVELLWENGQVVLNSQTHKKPVFNPVDSRQVQGNDQSTLRTNVSYGNSSNLFEEDETVSWIQYQLEDPLEQKLCSNFLPELPYCEVEADKPIRRFEEDKFAKFGAYNAHHGTANSQPSNMKLSCVQKFSGNPIPSPRFHFPDSSQKNNDFSRSQKVLNFAQFSAIPKVTSTTSTAQFGGKGTGNMLQSEITECSVVTVGSSHCGSNQSPRDRDVSRISSNGVWTTSLSDEPETFRDDIQRTCPKDEKGKSETHETTVTSSSGACGSSLGKTCGQSTRIHSQKRKGTDIEELEEQSEAVQLKPAQRTGSSRRNRAAEVHNLSERRRRDRINEKMRALQQLIPHSNKTDKASMLDEAIEYLKSLQFQLQVMWMGGGMAPVMVPGIQNYMSQMGMGLATPSLPPIHNHMNIPRLPLDQSKSLAQTPNQTVTFQTPVLGPFNFQNQMQNPALSEQYARYMGYHMMQSASQPLNAFRYGPQLVQHSQTMIQPRNSNGPLSGAVNTDDAVGGKMG